ncbi:MAG: hypothetical protein ACJA2S_000974 [Cyclobacteriaceae bacterium]|jgi:uncharacterized protein YcbX
MYADHFEVTQTGLMLDRHWVIIDENNAAITGRENAQTLAFSSKLFSDYLLVKHQGNSIKLPFELVNQQSIEIKIFSSLVNGIEISDEVNSWFSERLKQECRVVVLDSSRPRQVQEIHGGRNQEIVGFADMNPILLISEASLEDLNSRLEDPVSMKNFRPNIVVKGCDSFEEDTWKRIQIGGCEFRVVQKCERCVFATIDPDTLEKNKKAEPLRTLAKYRRTSGKDVAFGVHMIPEKLGTIYLDDQVEILA